MGSYARVIGAALAVVALWTTQGCYERVVQTRHGNLVSEVNKRDFDEKQGPLDEVMWGPVPDGQDPEAFYRKKKRLLSQ